MGAGLLILVSVGKENIYLSAQPEITYFKIAYKRYSNFSIETVAQYFKTIPDFGRRVTVNISKNADLLNQIYLFVQLPDIITSNHSMLPEGIKKFAWNKKVGLSLIKYIDLEMKEYYIPYYLLPQYNKECTELYFYFSCICLSANVLNGPVDTCINCIELILTDVIRSDKEMTFL